MVIELLTVTMNPSVVDAYLVRDREVWTAFLERQPGFLGKEVWVSNDEPGTVAMVIRWSSRELWKAITPDQVAAVDLDMGELLPDTLRCDDYDLA